MTNPYGVGSPFRLTLVITSLYVPFSYSMAYDFFFFVLAFTMTTHDLDDGMACLRKESSWLIHDFYDQRPTVLQSRGTLFVKLPLNDTTFLAFFWLLLYTLKTI
jgi:hypothetical protein